MPFGEPVNAKYQQGDRTDVCCNRGIHQEAVLKGLGYLRKTGTTKFVAKIDFEYHTGNEGQYDPENKKAAKTKQASQHRFQK
jgi:hypothetical protein